MSRVLVGWVLEPGPDEAREWLARELARREYQPSLGERVREWISRLLGEVTSAARDAGSPGPLVALVLLALLVVLVVLVLTRWQRRSGAAVAAPEVFDGARLTAQEHRDAAARALAEERYGDAVVESVRAVAAGLVERQLLADEPGTTTREMAARVTSAFPDERGAVAAVALAFEETLYGDRPAGEQQAHAAAALERRLRGASPADGAGVTGPVAAAPR